MTPAAVLETWSRSCPGPASSWPRRSPWRWAPWSAALEQAGREALEVPWPAAALADVDVPGDVERAQEGLHQA